MTAKGIGSEDRKHSDKGCDLYEYILNTCCPELHTKARFPSRMFDQCLAASNASQNRESEYVIDRAKLQYLHEKGIRVERSLWPADYLLAVVLNDLGVNKAFLDSIRNELDEMGLAIDGWFVEFGSEVFDDSGVRTSEPVLDDDVLRRVAEEMWGLRCRVFGRGLMNYELLADSLRMENTALVGLAVRRIARRFNRPGAIIAGTFGWRFGSEGFKEEELYDAIRQRKP